MSERPGANRFQSSEALSDRNFGRLLRAASLADVCLLMGGLSWFGFFSHELTSGPGARGQIADTLYGVGFIGFGISGGIQTAIDLIWTRSVPFGRYSTSFVWNVAISLLFLLGVLGDFVAYLFWRAGPSGVNDERITQYVSSHLWLIASVIVMWKNASRTERLEDKTDAFGNLFFFCESVLNVFARYTTNIKEPDEDDGRRELRLEFAASIFWILNATMYLCGDFMRIRALQGSDDRSSSSKKSSNGPTSVVDL